MIAQTSVFIQGGGPTGLVLANLLAIKGIDIVIVEKEKEIYPVPRATHLDEETLRNFQLTGLMEELKKYIEPFGNLEVANAGGKVIFAEKAQNTKVLHGYTGSYFFDQVAFENILWEGLKRFPQVKMLRGYEGISFEQKKDFVEIRIRNTANGAEETWRAKYLVACDGGRSAVRNYLGIEMDSFSAKRDWVIVDTVLKEEKDTAFLPNHFTYIFEKERLSIFAKGVGLNRRWEFQLQAGEDMPEEAMILAWVKKYISLEKLTLKRVVKYTHSTLVAQTWQKGNMFLAGDAAHLMPPTAGQGLCSGIRDAVNLAWKLTAVLNGANDSLLFSYEVERKPHLFGVLKRTSFFSKTLQADSAVEKGLRKAKFHALHFFPFIKNYIKDKYEVPDKVEGFFFASKSTFVGQHLPQFVLADGRFTDDLIGYHFVLITKKNIPNLNTLADLNDIFEDWLTKNELDFVLVRPDKIILAAGKITELEDLMTHFLPLYATQ